MGLPGSASVHSDVEQVAPGETWLAGLNLRVGFVTVQHWGCYSLDFLEDLLHVRLCSLLFFHLCLAGLADPGCSSDIVGPGVDNSAALAVDCRVYEEMASAHRCCCPANRSCQPSSAFLPHQEPLHPSSRELFSRARHGSSRWHSSIYHSLRCILD